jgi:cytoskeletal protein CcmA (bactofilin family)
MFKKYAKIFLKQPVSSPETPILFAPEEENPFSSLLMPPLEKEDPKASPLPETIIGENVCIQGTMAFQNLLRIDGAFEGDLMSEGILIIGPKGHVKSNLRLQEADIWGKLEGDIEVRRKLTIHRDAIVQGTIKAPLLVIEEGAQVIGHVTTTSMENEDTFISKG